MTQERDVAAELEQALHDFDMNRSEMGAAGTLRPGDGVLRNGAFVEVERLFPSPRRATRRQVLVRCTSGDQFVVDVGLVVQVVRKLEAATEVPTPPLAEVLARQDVETRRAS